VALKLPPVVADKQAVLTLLKELELFDEASRQAHLRSGVKIPTPAEHILLFAELNDLDLRKTTDRATALEGLDSLLHEAPTVHVSFAADPPREVLEKMVDWLRRESGRTVLLTVGLQPTLAGGCTVKTPTRLFDFSFRQRLDDGKKILAELIAQP
jgi:hypothetical protein